MTERDRDAEPRDQWLSPISRLGREVAIVNNHIAEITGAVGQDLMAGRVVAPSNAISMLRGQLSAVAFDASSILPRVDSFAAAVDKS